MSSARSTPAAPSFPTRRSSDLLRLRRGEPGDLDADVRCRSRGWRARGRIYDQVRLPRAQGVENEVFVERHWMGLSRDRKSTRLNSSDVEMAYAVFCLKKKEVQS